MSEKHFGNFMVSLSIFSVHCNSVFRIQGAFFCHIRPEYLLDMQEFKHWCSLQVQIFMHTQQSGLDLHHVN